MVAICDFAGFGDDGTFGVHLVLGYCVLVDLVSSLVCCFAGGLLGETCVGCRLLGCCLGFSWWLVLVVVMICDFVVAVSVACFIDVVVVEICDNVLSYWFIEEAWAGCGPCGFAVWFVF